MWLRKKGQALLAAFSNGDKNADLIVFNEVSERYGEDFATQWRLSILESREQSSMDDFGIGF